MVLLSNQKPETLPITFPEKKKQFSYFKEKEKENTENYGAEGMSLGMCFGTAIGASLHNIGIGISLGMLIGLAIGTCMRKEGQDGENAQEK